MDKETAILFQTYIRAYDANDFDTMAVVLEVAQRNDALGQWIWRHAVEHADDVELTPEQHEQIRKLIEQIRKGQ